LTVRSWTRLWIERKRTRVSWLYHRSLKKNASGNGSKYFLWGFPRILGGHKQSDRNRLELFWGIERLSRIDITVAIEVFLGIPSPTTYYRKR